MKKALFTSTLFTVIILCACNDRNDYKTNVNNLAAYVDSVADLQPVYTESQWARIDEGYNERLGKVESTKEVDSNEKAKLEESRSQYQVLREKYKLNIQKQKEASEYEASVNKARQAVRHDLFGERITDNWNFVTPANVVSIYENFVDKVRRNGDNYTDTDWSEVRSLWKSLNERKDEIDKDMSTKDNAKVAGLRVAFTAVKSVSKPLSKVKQEVREDQNKK